MSILISIVVAVLIHAINDIVLPIVAGKELKKRGKLFKDEKASLFKIIRSYIPDLIPGINIIAILFHLITDIGLIAFFDKIIDNMGNYSDAYSAESIKNKYERNESLKKEIIDAMTLEGASELRKDIELNLIKSHAGKKEKGSSFRADPEFSEKEYEWACAYEDARLFVDNLFTDASISKKEKYEIIKELIEFAKYVDNIKPEYDPELDEETKYETNNLTFDTNRTERAKSRAVSNKVLGIINRHL